MTLRERGIIYGALIFCTIAMSYFWIVDPSLLLQVKMNNALQTSNQEEKILNNEILLITKRLQKDPLEEINKKIAFTETTLARLNEQLDDKLVKFIYAHKMPIALSKVLSKTPGVKITALSSLPVKVFYESSPEEDSATQSLFYQHTLQITLQGNYNTIYQYLLNVEALQDKFYWHSFDYQVSTYPLAQVIIQIYTLSDQQDLVSG